ncbi:uncharacterized protein PRCAT00002934001 [Priceomyces carsonii]|uniref:uncharacterized protein n=1 Tax=Priceomyces carsonii TaxID=28549 RepID=UPI002ED915BE|nr:unnamed protein product [Priceomyces carsonii]
MEKERIGFDRDVITVDPDCNSELDVSTEESESSEEETSDEEEQDIAEEHCGYTYTREDFFEEYADKYIKFTNENPTTYHVIDFFRGILEENGFIYIPETERLEDTIKKTIKEEGGLYFSIRSDLTLVAFMVGGSWKESSGIGAVGTHADALTVKLKPSSLKHTIDGYEMLGVAPYAGTLNYLWTDRDLGIGGAILVREGGEIKRKNVSSSPIPIAKIPSLAPHFGEVANRVYNKETQEVPVIGYGLREDPATNEEKESPVYGKHSIDLLRYISRLSQTPLKDIVSLDLELFDVQEATRGGIAKEFIFAPRIDDRLCSFSAIYGLIQHSKNYFSGSNTGSLKEYDGLDLVWLCDNEEIGSQTRTSARGGFLRSVLNKVLEAKNYGNIETTFANSIILSADVTHALNPNFKNVYLDDNYPLPNTGLTLKIDSNQHVVTDSTGIALMNNIASKNSLKLQQFHIRNGSPSGSTNGPIFATETGARVIDVGLPQLSMHSIRAACGYKEVGLGIETFSSFFKDWRQEYAKFHYS